MERPVFSNKNSKLVSQVTEKVTAWTGVEDEIGLDAARVAALKAANLAAAAAQTEMFAKRAASEAATQTFNSSCRTVRELAGNAIRSIDNFARIENNPGVWDTAQIPPPKDPSALPPPGQPSSMTASLNSLGELTLKWKCTNPRGVNGVVYQVFRGLNGATPTLLDLVGEKTLVDGTIPAGTAAVAYYIRARRGGLNGQPSSQFTVRFGVAGAGNMVIADQFTSGMNGTGGKLAA